MAEPHPQEPAPIKRKGFHYGRGGLAVGGVRRVPVEKLRELMLPENIKGVRARKCAEEEAKALCRKPWIAAQLRHYGQEVTSKESMDQLRSRLKTCVKENKV
jgi:hypothetical protein